MTLAGARIRGPFRRKLQMAQPIQDLTPTLNSLFGFSAFRPNQEAVVRSILAGRDAFVVMPTGGGKSLCYQLPAHVLPGMCVVISPLISLMKDQVDAACAIGLRAACLNSSQPSAERHAVRTKLSRGELDLLYVSPERLAIQSFADTLAGTRVSFIAVDEAHCISEWGHDFRPDYLELANLVDVFPESPVAAFTATATRNVQSDIVSKLRLRDPHVVRASFDRPNLFYQVAAKEDAERQILDFVRQRPGEPGIVYRTTRKAVEATAARLSQWGVRVRAYHAGLEDERRAASQEAFNRDEVDVVVATIAFGMGIDKSNVRYVVHGDLPKSIEGYYQETGRAGRDGEPAYCLLLFGRGDIGKVRYFINAMTDEREKRHAGQCLNDMVGYASVHVCRRRQLLAYFDEAYNRDNCGACDVCTGEVEKVDATIDAQKLLSAIVRTGQRFGIKHIIDVVAGADTQRIRDLGHDRIKTYGVGRERSKAYWRRLVDNLLGQAIIRQSDSEYPVLVLEEAARDVLSGQTTLYLLREKEGGGRRSRRRVAEEDGGGYEHALFERLRALRKRLASAQGVPPYVVFSDRTLREMARALPATPSELMEISGVGETKLARYGTEFLEAIATHGGATIQPDGARSAP